MKSELTLREIPTLTSENFRSGETEFLTSPLPSAAPLACLPV